jgi:hypothetical protein
VLQPPHTAAAAWQPLQIAAVLQLFHQPSTGAWAHTFVLLSGGCMAGS